MKVIINSCYGGFGISNEALKLYLDKKGIKYTIEEKNSSFGNDFYGLDGKYLLGREIARNDPVLIEIIEELKDKANGFCAKLEIVDIPDDAEWYIEEYDGSEWVAEKHRTWGR